MQNYQTDQTLTKRYFRSNKIF